MAAKNIEILMIEDDPGDADLTKELLEEARGNVNVHVLQNGELALKFLRREGEFWNAVMPDLILLDLNLPRIDGREVLRAIKSDLNLRCIPVVVLTTSDADEDILYSYDLGASSFVTKPVGLKQFTQIVKAIENFWFAVVKFPAKRKL